MDTSDYQYWDCYVCGILGRSFTDADECWNDLKAHEKTVEHLNKEHSNLVKAVKEATVNLRNFETENGLPYIEI